MTLQAYSQSHNVAFGTSGVRALVDDLTPAICYAFGRAFIDAVASGADVIYLGMDLRPSSPQIAKAITKAIIDSGKNAVFCGALPTPALAYTAQLDNAPAIMITGSHIPFDRNGIKFYSANGEITKAEEVAILATDIDCYPANSDHQANLPDIFSKSTDLYLQRYYDLLPAGFLVGKKIGVYEHSGVGRDLIKKALIHFGSEVISIGRTDTFVPIDTEAVSDEDKAKGQQWARKFKLDAIVSTDGDADRPLIADEKGHWLRGDLVGVLCAQYLGASHIATPINANTALERALPDATTCRTRIGSPYVIEGMQQLAAQLDARVMGYEANGGVLIGSDFELAGNTLKALPTRDALLPILIVLAASYQQQQPVSALLATLPGRYTASDRIKDISTDKSRAYIDRLIADRALQTQLLQACYADVESLPQVSELNTLDGLRMPLSNGDILHLRPSGNAPELRCYAEAASQQMAEQMVNRVLNYLTEAL